MTGKFKQDLMKEIERCESNDWQDNWDFRRFGTEPDRSLFDGFRKKIRRTLEAIGLRSNRIQAVLNSNDSHLQWLYESLQDDESRNLLVSLMAYRLLGYRKVKLPLNTPAYWRILDTLDRESEQSDSVELGFRGWKLAQFDLSDEGYPIRIYTRPSGVFTQLLLQQYRCVTADHVIEVGAGDTVIDAGGCYGDTALYFAYKAGSNGRVFSFEFMPGNVEIFQRNLALNPEFASSVEIVRNAVWSKSKQKLFVEGAGPAARVTATPKDAIVDEVETLSIDDLVRGNNLERVDFIKMDVEGAETEALKGAEAAIRRDHPVLAISVYHDVQDFWTIPLWIDSLGLGYRFYLRHFTIHAEETVLFAEVAP